MLSALRRHEAQRRGGAAVRVAVVAILARGAADARRARAGRRHLLQPRDARRHLVRMVPGAAEATATRGVVIGGGEEAVQPRRADDRARLAGLQAEDAVQVVQIQRLDLAGHAMDLERHVEFVSFVGQRL